MKQLTRDDVYSLDKYSDVRPAFRARVMEYKRDRQVPVGPQTLLLFEDRLTVHYQIQETLRAGKMSDEANIERVLAAHNPLIPDGNNWKAMLTFECENEQTCSDALATLQGIERRVWVQVHGHDKVFSAPIEGASRSSDTAHSAVYFLCFEFTPAMCAAIKSGVAIGMGVDHPQHTCQIEPIPDEVHASLAGDLD